jgi:GxxExxY protein
MQNPKIVENLLFKEECYTVIGMCIRIHNKLGKGFKEVVYKDAMEVEFKKAGILYKKKKNSISNTKELAFLTSLMLTF